MALLQCNFFSASLMRTVPIQVILPTDKLLAPGQSKTEDKPFKTLYLLHGIFGNYTDWVNGTRIQAWAQDKNLAVVMPSGSNKFYVDNNVPGEHYGTFIHKELVEFTRKSFPLSRKREDTFIGGLSMGGYGAVINALKAPETFGAVCALSGAYIIDHVSTITEDSDNIFASRQYFELVFGKLNEVVGSDKDYNALAERLVKEKSPLPRFYIACGTGDELMDTNTALRDKLKSLGYDVTWEEGPGGHDWVFWDTYIKKSIDWLPLDDEQKGVSSGNVN